MDGIAPTIAAGDVEVDGNDGTGTVAWSWPVVESSDPWAYETTVELRRSGDTWAVRWAPTVVEPSLTDDEVLEATTIPATRGEILGARGAVIVTDRPVLRFGIDRVQVSKAEAGDSARALAELVGVDVAPYVKAVRAAGDRAFVEAISYRKAEVPAGVLESLDGIPGAVAIADDISLAPTREFAAPILGRVGPVTAEMIEEDPDRYQVGDIAGTSGLQARYDEQLGGSPGRLVEAVSETEPGPARDLFRVQETDGDPLELTLDPDLQTDAEALLADVDLRQRTGRDPAQRRRDPRRRQRAGHRRAELRDVRAVPAGLDVQDRQQPGAAPRRAHARQHGELPADTDGRRQGVRQLQRLPELGQRRHPAPHRGRAVVQHRLHRCARPAGGRRPGSTPRRASASASTTTSASRRTSAASEPPASETEAAADLIGQGTVLASPMTMAAVIASVQEGRLVVPRLRGAGTTSPPTTTPPLTEQEAEQLRTCCAESSPRAAAASSPTYPGRRSSPRPARPSSSRGRRRVQTHAWMVAAQGDLAVAVFVEIGESGSRTAGPILEAFLRR